jgi:catechol 2,3-dioxygenase-like lactoylglutathione lyase family enzyme
MEQRLSFVTLGVADVARCRKFYRRLGWKESKASNKEVAFFQAGKMVFALWGYRLLALDAGLRVGRKRAYRGFALAHNVRSPRAVDRLLAAAVKAGGKLLKPGHKAFWGGYTGYFADPDGNPWEVAWNPLFPLGRDGGVKLPR